MPGEQDHARIPRGGRGRGHGDGAGRGGNGKSSNPFRCADLHGYHWLFMALKGVFNG